MILFTCMNGALVSSAVSEGVSGGHMMSDWPLSRPDLGPVYPCFFFVSGTLETEIGSKYTAPCHCQTSSNRFWTHSDWFQLMNIGPDSMISRVSLKAASKETVTSSNTHSSTKQF